MPGAYNLTFLFSLDNHSKQAGDECHLFPAVPFFYALYLAFPQPVHRFLSFQGSPCGLERKEAHPELDESFHAAMVLLDEVGEVLPLSQQSRFLCHSSFSDLL